MKYIAIAFLVNATSAFKIALKDDPVCSSQGCFDNTLHYTDENELPFKNGYTVPNFGDVDVDIAASNSNLAAAETKLDNKNWLPSNWQDGGQPVIPKSYTVPNFGMDRDVSNSLSHMQVAEKLVGHKWVWTGDEWKNKARHNAHTPYYEKAPVLEHDIVVSQNDLKNAEAKLDHKFELP